MVNFRKQASSVAEDDGEGVSCFHCLAATCADGGRQGVKLV